MKARGLVLLAAWMVILGVAAAPSPGAAAGDALVWGDGLPANLDPHDPYDVPSALIQLNVYDNLYRYQGNPPQLQPWLAESHTASRDGRTWEFKLRKGVKFHDGSPLTAEDVVYSARRIVGIGKAAAGPLKAAKIESVTAVDPSTVRFVLERPYAPFLSIIPVLTIVNRRVIEPHVKGGDWGNGWLSSQGAGSGAYIPDPASYIPLKALDLKRNPDHFMGWGHNAKPIDLIRVRPVAETTTRVLALMKGEIDAGDSYLPTDQVERLSKVKDVVVHRNESMRIFVIRMNNTKPPFDNVHFRRCLSQAFNYDGFIGVILKNFAERNPAPVPKNLWGYPEGVKGYAFDLARARADCDRAKAEGAPVDREVQLHIQTGLDQTLQAAQLFQSDARKLGIDMKIVPNTWPNLTASTGKPDTSPDMWIHWVSAYFIDPENWIGTMYDSQFHGTWKASAWYKNGQVDELLRSARANPNREERARLYAQAARLVVEEAPDIWVYNTVELRGMRARVKGFKFSPVGSGSELRHLSLAAS
jgi:peptide/nickel transport system substrate-binding protein